MSVTLMARVWRMDIPTTDKMVLLALADAANDDGVTWIPVCSRKRGEKMDLLMKCSLGERAIQGAIKRLQAEGLIKRDEKPGRGCIYTVLPPQDMRPAADAPPQEKTQTPAADAGKPSVTIMKETKVSSERVIAAWNVMAEKHKLPTVRVLDNSRKQTLRLRLKEHGEAVLLEAIERVGKSPWLRGEGRDNNWRPTIDFILQPSSLRKVLEGCYDPKDDGASEKWSPERQAAYAAKLRQSAQDDERRKWEGVGAVAAKIVGEVRPQ